MAGPSRTPRRDPDDPFGTLFREFEAEFRRMQEDMSKLMEQALRSADIPKGHTRPGNPFVYGFTMRVGPDGRPHFEPFGNAPGAKRPTEVAVEGAREPITDLIEYDDHLTVTVELPGVEKDDVEVFTTERRLTIKVDAATRKYYKEIQLPVPVVEDGTEATFKNGVLDVVLKRQEQSAPPTGRRVNVK